MKTIVKIQTSLIITLLLSIGSIDSSYTQGVSKAGTTAAEFLKIGVGPRAVGMGGAFVAVSDDVTALYWNPAGISSLESNEIITTHSQWIGDLDFNYIGTVFNFEGIGHFGASLTMLSVPDMLVRTEEFQEGTGERFDAADYAVALAYATTIGERFSIGGNIKFVQQRIWHSKADAFGFDLGSKFKTDFFGGMVIGATIYNFGSKLQMEGRDLRTFVDPDPNVEGNNDQIPTNIETDRWDLPLNFQVGIALSPVQTRMHQFLFAVDALYPSSNYPSVNIGGEYGYQERVFLRGGYQSLFLEDVEAGLNGGLGVNQTLFNGVLVRLSYSFKSAGRLGDIHSLAIELGF